MKITPKLEQQFTQAVQTSMRIEGYKTQAPPQIQAQARALMEQKRVQVSIPSK